MTVGRIVSTWSQHGSGVQSHRASQLECGSVDTAQAGWFASSIQRQWNLGGDSTVKLADSGSMVCDGMRCRRRSMWSNAGQGSTANGIIIPLRRALIVRLVVQNMVMPIIEVGMVECFQP
uniref:Uncharacterized protein n=1 Tax=Sphaerodactylus townsendi TaxID=933632 RepID=A0ACB8G386_9SAUR